MRDVGDDPGAEASGALPTQVDAPSGRRREATQPGAPPGRPSLSAFDPPPQRFETRGEIGRGGMGRVENAFDRALGRQVAIKHILSDSPVDLARFEREARITARLEHPGIVPVHDAGRSADGTPYYVMRHVDGRPLDEIVSARTQLAERLALVPDVLAVCDAVGYAHARGVVHRDIKPSNILVGPFGETLLIDWGLARETAAPDADDGALLGHDDPQLTRAGAVAGTPGFMAPEQARGERIDQRADVFSLGATLYHVLAGRPPYAAPSATEMIHAAAIERAPEWERIPRAVPADLVAIVHKAMASDPAARYPDASAMAADLRRFVTGQLVAAHAYGLVEQLARFVRRHRAALAVAAIAAVLLAVVGVLSFRRVLAERDAADAAREASEARRKETADLRDGLLVDHAKSLADDDPVAAIALLRDLPVESTRWPQAYAAASAAFFRGIPSGFELGPEALASLTIAPDDTHALAITVAGNVVYIDLVARTQRTLERRRSSCVFVLHGTHLLCNPYAPELHLIDIATGASQSITLPGGPQDVFSDGEARGWAQVQGELYELDLAHPAAPVPAPSFHGVTEARFVAGAQRLVVVLPTTVVIRGPARTWTIPQRGRLSVPVDDGTRTVLQLDGHLEIWDLAAEPVRVRPVVTTANEYPVGLVADVVYSTDGSTCTARHGDHTWEVSSHLGTFTSPPGAFVGAQSDGSVIIADADGSYLLARRPLTYTRLALSANHRFLVAGTSSGLVVWWDLFTFRPRGTHIDETEHPLKIGKWLWTNRSMAGIVRYDLQTRTALEFAVEPFLTAVLDPDERFLVTGNPERVTAYDASDGHVVLELRGEHNWTFGALGLVTLSADGLVLARYALPDVRAEALGTLPEPATAMFERGTRELLVTATQTCRATPGRALECAKLPPTTLAPDALALDGDGGAWLVSEGALYRWDLGGAWRAVPTDQRLSGLASADDRTIAFGSQALTLLEDPPRALSLPSVTEVEAAHGIAVYESSRDALSIVDLASGATFAIPVRGRTSAITDGHRIVTEPASGRGWIDLITLTVPRDPAALRAWLAASTNARTTHAGLVSFP